MPGANRPAVRAGEGRTLPPYIDLAEAYVPIQEYGPQYTPDDALDHGTLWPVLDRPFTCPAEKGETSWR